MNGGYEDYQQRERQRPGYPARPDGQGGQPRGPWPPRAGQPQPAPRQMPGRPGVPPRGTPPRGAPPRTPPPGPAQPWGTGPVQPGGHPNPRDAARDAGGRPGSSGRTRFNAGPGFSDDVFLPGWDDGDEGGATRGGQRVRDRDELFDDDLYDQGYGRPARRRRRFRWLAPLIALLVIVTPIGAGGYFGFRFYMGKYHPADYSGSGYGSVLVHVTSGATATSLGPELQRLGVVASSRALVLAGEASTSADTLEAGYFKLHLHMRASLAWATLTNPKNMVQTLVAFPEGLRAASIVALLGQHTALSLSDYQAAIKNTAALGLPAYARGNPEGYLFPATYQITPNETALQVLQAMVAKYDQEAQALHLTTAASQVVINGHRLTVGQVMIIASLVQAEGGRTSDYPKIASVVYNRLKAGMKLQFDSTVFYGLGKFGTAATTAEINTNTPYNTYLHTGLPPAPIDNPGVAAINAALHPATTSYLYFLSLKNGTTEFSANPIRG